MKAEIIAVGTELLLGQVVNTNATFLSEELANLGFDVYFHSVVGDNPKRLEELLKQAEKRSELIVLCGGLGPTQDDLTRDIVAEHVGASLILDEIGLTKVKNHLEGTGKSMTENNKKQALTIEGGYPLQNVTGLAVGVLYKSKTNVYLLLPGPPRELKPMFHEEAKPLLMELLPQRDRLTSKVLRFYGIGESKLVTVLADLIDNQKNPTIAPYAKSNEVTLRVTAKTESEEEAEELLAEIETEIMSKVGDYFYGYGERNSLEQETVKVLKKYHKTVTSAESLTAGLFQSTLGKVAGVSEVFLGGYVTYANEIKEKLLGISHDLVTNYGVVSEECAIAMAENSRKQLEADYSISFTGVAGPDTSEDKEVGTVWIGVSSKKCGTFAKKYQFKRDRDYIRHSAMMAGLDLLRKQVIKENEK